jgi:uncharacterized protein YbaP (TraB family)
MLRLALARQFSAIAAITLFAFLFVAATAMARDTTASPAIWKIDGEKGDIYFFGSFHILPKDLVWRTPALDAALNVANQIVFEVDFDQAQDASVMGDLVARHGFLPPDKSLRRMIAVEYRAKLEATAADLGLPIASVDRMRPWLAALTITSLTAIRQTSRTGKKPDPAAAMSEQGGVDLKLWNWAKQNGKPRGALETVESQIQVFANLTPEQEVQYLVMILQQGSKVEESIDLLLNAWKTGNIRELDRALNGDMDSFPAMRKALFDDRHANWMPQIEAMLNDGRTHVIVVGAAHLVGKGSVIDLLRAKGVRVEGP